MKVEALFFTRKVSEESHSKISICVVYYILVESVYKVPGDDSRVYGVFTTVGSGFRGSAVCSFTLDSIDSVFKGRFKEQATSSSSWLPVLSSKVPQPRPGECVNDTQALPGKS